MKKSFKLLNWKLILTIFLTLLIPVIYRTTRMFFVGTFSDTWGFSIAGNLQWINVIFEILEEAFLLPLFFTLRKIMNDDNVEKRNRKITFQILTIFLIYLICIIFFVIFTKEMTKMMSVNTINATTIEFIRVEFIARLFVMMAKIGTVFLIAKNKWKSVILLLAISTMLNVLLDLFITSDTNLSLKKGIVWIAYTQLITASIMSIFYLTFTYFAYGYKLKHMIPYIFFEKRNWKQHFYVGLESLIRNGFFILFVIKTINKLDSQYSQSNFWVANSFIWHWLLLPVLTISQYLNRDQALSSEKHSLKERLSAPFVIIGVIVIVWMALIPAYQPFIKVVLNNSNSQLIAHLVLISIGFYVVMAFNDPIDKILFGDGKAQYVLLQSIIVNIAVYIPYYYLKDSMTLDDVALMMGTGIAIDSLITFIVFFFWVKNQNGIVKKQHIY